jgi:hypothetical protein
MTTAENLPDAMTRPAATVSIAGVLWPTYKVVALLIGVVIFAVVGMVTMSVAPAILIASGAATIAWIGLGLRGFTHR